MSNLFEQRSNISIVIAEDDYLVSREVVRIAEAAGLTVLGVAADGLEALELVKRHSPGAVILDLDMPGMSGLEAARRIRAEKPTPVVILTAYEPREFLREATEAGVGAYLTKPSDSAELLRAVEIAVARHGDLMDLRRKNAELQEALDKVKTLRGLLPICASCKKIRDDQGYWEQVESYIGKRTDVEFSHGICPDCAQRYYPEFTQDEDR